ncbi:MAG TPA: TolC family protein, partial [Gemmatimonadaceae bacterium]
PEIADLGVRAAASAWIPTLSASLAKSRAESPATGSLDGPLGVLTDRQLSSDIVVSQRLPWGAAYQLGWSGSRNASNSVFNRYQPQLNAGATARIEQPLLRGFAIDSARADRERSVNGRDLAQFELDATVAATTRAVLHAYWQWVYARDLLAVERDAHALAQTLLDGNRARVAAGAMAAVDVVEAEAEVARRDEAIIIADKNVANAEDRLRVLMLDPSATEYRAPFEPVDSSASRSSQAGVEAVARALAERLDLKVLRTSVAIDAVNVRQFRNDTLPDATVIADYSVQGAGGTELLRDAGLGTPVTGTLQRGFGSVLDDLTRFRYPAWSVQLSVGYPLGTSAAEANAARARVEQRRTETALAALEQQIVTEVNAARREVDANERRLQSTTTAVSLAERRLGAEEQKFNVGLSTSFFVFQAQRDLTSAREARLRSILDQRLSVADFDAVQLVPLAPTQ